MEAGSLQQWAVTQQEATGTHSTTGNFHVSIRKKLYCDGGQVLEQIFQKGCGDSFPGNTQTPVVLGSLL